MRKPTLRIATLVLSFGILIYLGFLIYNAFWQPVVVVIPNDYRGVIRVQYQASGLVWLSGYKKKIIVRDREIIKLRSRLPYEHYCATVGMFEDGKKVDLGDSEKPSTDKRVRLYLVGFIEHKEVWFAVGDANDLREAQQERLRVFLSSEIPE